VFVCGDNAPVTGDGFLFDELDLCGAPNYAGVRITGATRPEIPGLPRAGERRIPVVLDVDRHFFFTADADGTERRGSALLGTVISFEDELGATFQVLFAAINDHHNDPAPIVFQAGRPEPVPTYELKVRRPTDVGSDNAPAFPRFVCNHEEVPADPLWAAYPHDSLVFRGDHYSGLEKRVREDSDPAQGWSFLACAGGAGAKMHLYRHTFAGGFDYASGHDTADYPTELKERTALVKAITADYCDSGADRFTVRGQPLQLAVRKDWWPATDLSVPGGVRSIEAVWTPRGARCLDEPRHVTRDSIPCAAALNGCGQVSGTSWQGDDYVITANPHPVL
jgi:hypothetical protein